MRTKVDFETLSVPYKLGSVSTNKMYQRRSVQFVNGFLAQTKQIAYSERGIGNMTYLIAIFLIGWSSIVLSQELRPNMFLIMVDDMVKTKTIYNKYIFNELFVCRALTTSVFTARIKFQRQISMQF